MVNFCHIAPISAFNMVRGRNVHLVLAHLIEESAAYRDFYKMESEMGSVIICDNSGFEMYKRGLPMMEPEKVMDLAAMVDSDYVVLSDYPAEHQQRTIETAEMQKPLAEAAGFKTFFVPQSIIGDLDGYVQACEWGINNCDLTGISILGAPNAFGSIEKGNKLQRFMSRWKIMKELDKRGVLTKDNCFHFLGMLDGPNEIELVRDYHQFIYSWDSSAAVWAGMNGIKFDNSPTGLINGKFEDEVDFETNMSYDTSYVGYNINFIDRLCDD